MIKDFVHYYKRGVMITVVRHPSFIFAKTMSKSKGAKEVLGTDEL
jgi:hypothetical protein